MKNNTPIYLPRETRRKKIEKISHLSVNIHALKCLHNTFDSPGWKMVFNLLHLNAFILN